MSLFRLIIYALIIYFVVKFVKYIIMLSSPKSEIKSSADRKKPLDLSDADIEDADFKEIDED